MAMWNEEILERAPRSAAWARALAVACALALAGGGIAAHAQSGAGSPGGNDSDAGGTRASTGAGNAIGAGTTRFVPGLAGDAGGSRASQGPGSTATVRIREGRPAPDGDGDGTTPGPTTTTYLAPGSEGWCHGAAVATMPVPDRISGRNLERLDAARLTVLPRSDQRPRRVRDSYVYTLAVYQHEVSSDMPDLRLGGLFLGSVAHEPVTPVFVERVNDILCIDLPDEQVYELAANAEAHRLGLENRRRRGNP